MPHVLPHPEPPLVDAVAGLRLRLWRPDDAGALAAAWADAEIQKWTLVPAQRTEADAARWLAAEPLRRERGLALDLVISPAGSSSPVDDSDMTVLGEVGLVPLAGGPSRAELGWWVAAPHRRRGIATAAVRLFAGWARSELGFDDLFAEVDPDNPASVWVAEAADLRLRIR